MQFIVKITGDAAETENEIYRNDTMFVAINRTSISRCLEIMSTVPQISEYSRWLT